MTNLHTTSWLLYLKNIFDTQILDMENIHVFVKQVGMQREVLWPNYYFLSDSRLWNPCLRITFDLVKCATIQTIF